MKDEENVWTCKCCKRAFLSNISAEYRIGELDKDCHEFMENARKEVEKE